MSKIYRRNITILQGFSQVIIAVLVPLLSTANAEKFIPLINLKGYQCILNDNGEVKNYQFILNKIRTENKKIKLKIKKMTLLVPFDAESEILFRLERKLYSLSAAKVELKDCKNKIGTIAPVPTSTAASTITTSPTETPTLQTPTSTPTVTPTPRCFQSGDCIFPEKAAFEEHMLNKGEQYGKWILAHKNDPAVDPPLGSYYYDAARVFYQIADYTGEPEWNEYADAAAYVYRDRYVIPNNGGVPGYWHFTRGLVMNYERTGNVASKNAAILLSKKASYAADTTPLEWVTPYGLSREVAYAIMSYLDSERLGEPRRARLNTYVGIALGHINQWLNGDDPAYAPFMFALTADALIQYNSTVEAKPEILAKIKALADWTWVHCWVEANESFIYRLPETNGAPDLNLLIAPTYEWLYKMTGDAQYRVKADKIFKGGVKYAWLGGAKQFNQNYRVSFDYLNSRILP